MINGGLEPLKIRPNTYFRGSGPGKFLKIQPKLTTPGKFRQSPFILKTKIGTLRIICHLFTQVNRK